MSEQSNEAPVVEKAPAPVFVFETLEAAKASPPKEGKAPFRLYSVDIGGKTLYVHDRNPVTALGRAAAHVGYQAVVAEGGKGHTAPLTPETVVEFVTGMSDDQKAALLAQLGVKPKRAKVEG